ncbi:MAG: hypothetical protein J6X60_04650, partial [Ruminiclostridium sp.]|nr:hypothetical protein [Ruminiclostridium sp.]
MSTEASVLSEDTSAVQESSASAAALASEDEPVTKETKKTLTIALKSINNVYSPFCAEDDFTALTDKLTGVTLFGNTRMGNRVSTGSTAATEQYAGKMYAYSSAADVFSSYDELTDTTEFTIRLRNDLRFADGEQLDADDVLFTLYMHLDPSYTGRYPLHDVGITGALNYRYNSLQADGITQEQIDEVLSSDEIRSVIMNRITLPTLSEQFRNVESLYEDSAYAIYTSKYPRPEDLFTFFYSIDSNYSSAGRNKEQVIKDVAAMYGSDYRQLASMTVGDEKLFDEEVLSLAVGYITKDTTRQTISSVEGIRKKGQLEVSVKVSGDGKLFEDAMSSVVIAPLHHYGSEAMFDTSKSLFGFAKGAADVIMEQKLDKPLGAGAYCITGFESGAVNMTANRFFYKGTPESDSLKLIPTGGKSPAEIIADGDADVCSAEGSTKSYNEIDAANKAMEKIYPAISEDLGYGYIGINANTVKLGDPFSPRSYSLRKGLATAIAFFKEKSLENYFGGFGIVTDYPYIQNISADKDAEGYRMPFTLNHDGNEIFTSGMNEDERREAVKQACFGYFTAAGYSYDGKMITAAPYDGTTIFNAVIVAGGNGNHPSYIALKNASELLAEIGITLNVTDITDAGVLWESLNEGTNEIWAGAWNSEDIRTIYVESYYGADSTRLKQ